MYFTAVLNLSRSDEKFPVNLDDVWPLVYVRKDVAVKALRENNLFMEGIDYILVHQNVQQDCTENQPLHQNVQRTEQPLTQNGEWSANGQFNGSDKVTYMLSVPCLEFFIARKVRPVFEVYRQVFHKVDSGELLPSPIVAKPTDLVSTLAPLIHFHDAIIKRVENLIYK